MKITKDKLFWHGRFFDCNGVRFFNWTASGFEFAFTGKKAVCTIISDCDKQKKTERGWIAVFVEDFKTGTPICAENLGASASAKVARQSGEPYKRIELTEKKGDYVIFESDKICTVKIHVMKTSEDAFGMAGFSGLKIDGELKNLSAQKKKLNLQFIGDSITCGYGIDGLWGKDTFTTKTERADKSYAYLTAKKLSAEYQMISWSGIGLISKYVDMEVDLPDDEWTMLRTFPYTDKSAALRLKFEPEVWDASRYTPDIVVINLGTNDMSFTRGRPDRIRTFINLYRALLEEVHRQTPNAKICCCLGVMGQDLCPAMKTAVKHFSREFPSAQIKAIVFPMQDEKDGIGADFHPSAKTHKKMAEKLVKALEKW